MNKVTENLILDIDDIRNLFGNLDSNIDFISKKFDVSIKNNEQGLSITGDEKMVLLCSKAIEFLVKDKSSENLDKQKLSYIVEKVKSENKEILNDWLDYVICLNAKLKPIKPKTLGQRKYISAIEDNIITFGIGPAGTGKTFLAIAMAAKALKNNSVSKIILTRPAVEAGENLGFLPGDLQEKIDPYLRPLYDSLYNILGYDNFLRLKEKGIIEVAPLAYMRGRTLDDAFIILDEAQNATNEQMKMFLTRIGFESKAVVTGDITQIDLGRRKSSGLVSVSKILNNIKGINFNYFDSSDVVRHSIVMKIIDAYTKYEDSLVVKK
ncbi:PhoH family protein [Parvimonas micra]|uniref:PhoH-like protein n=1 Tax=Parvimonas micra TaxID=33033 RepID=A0A0B4S183_9FIRM|nr:PhoH family protein [Parvimonas micra]AIZ36500.1 phosphate starvation protein PhoH [Parvimonas micra]MCZ7406760.1 PhoH family protein [Parvimonas micra]MCZ7410108.1 PhoH family protein [Parvimonas micra]MCZ7411877.1 PhoH family protein [Parvimonas micra]WBB30216.1 PhoH family protein [Parvimonas micra]